MNILAIAHRDSGDVSLSIPAAREACRLAPSHVESFVTLSSDYPLEGDAERAREIADRSIDLDPGFAVSSFAGSQPYKKPETLASVCEALRRTGLPE